MRQRTKCLLYKVNGYLIKIENFDFINFFPTLFDQNKTKKNLINCE
jgi:hypothetical protein